MASPNYTFQSSQYQKPYDDINTISLDSIDELNLNYYSINSNNGVTNTTNHTSLVSTSHNYKKWLTGTCL